MHHTVLSLYVFERSILIQLYASLKQLYTHYKTIFCSAVIASDAIKLWQTYERFIHTHTLIKENFDRKIFDSIESSHLSEKRFEMKIYFWPKFRIYIIRFGQFFSKHTSNDYQTVHAGLYFEFIYMQTIWVILLATYNRICMQIKYKFYSTWSSDDHWIKMS